MLSESEASSSYLALFQGKSPARSPDTNAARARSTEEAARRISHALQDTPVPPLRLSERGLGGEARRPLDILHLTPQTREARNLMRLHLHRLFMAPTVHVESADTARTSLRID